MRTIVFNDTSIDDHHGCQLVMSQIDKLTKQSGMDIVLSCPLGYEWERDAWLKAEIGKVDLCIVNGEGTMHDDAPNAMRLGRLAKFCSEQGIPCFLINSVWQNNHELNKLAPFFTSIYVRDPLSQTELANIGLSATVVPDLTLSLDIEESANHRQGIILSGSVLPQVLTKAWKETCKVKGSRSVRYLSIRTLPPRPDKESLKHFAHIYTKRRRKMLRHIIISLLNRYPSELTGKKLSRLRWRFAALSVNDFLGRLKRAEGVITGRFHMVTLCIATATPFYALPSNTFKIEGLLQQLDMTDRICSSYEEGLARRGDMPFSEDELRTIARYIADTKEKAHAMFRAMHDLVSSRQVNHGAIES